MNPEWSELAALLDRQAIYDVVVRYCRAIDRVDMDLLRSCYHQGAVHQGAGDVQSIESFLASAESGLRSKFSGTSHFVSNHLAEIAGDRAIAETYVLAQHWGEPIDDATINFSTGSRYLDVFERRPEAGWRITERRVVRELTTVIPARSRAEGQEPAIAAAILGRAPGGQRDDTDLSYVIARENGLPALGGRRGS
jgi:SnoaL-like protein